MVTYKEIPGFSGYRAGTDGTIWSCWHTRGQGYGRALVKVQTAEWVQLSGEPRQEDGRLRFTLKRDDGTYCRRYGSHFVLLAFVGPRPAGLECCHGDGNCLNDAPHNLRWDTRQSNDDDKRKHGAMACGEKINTAKLTEADVKEIRAAGYPLKPHAEKHGVSTTLISLILRRKVWCHV